MLFLLSTAGGVPTSGCDTTLPGYLINPSLFLHLCERCLNSVHLIRATGVLNDIYISLGSQL